MNFYTFDLVSPPITLFYHGQTTHSSIISIIISFLAIIVLIILTIVFSLDFLLHKNPTTYYYRKYVEDIGIYPLNSSSVFHFMAFATEGIFDKRAFSIIGIREGLDVLLETNNETNFNHWIYEYCNETDAGDFYDLLGNYSKYYAYGLCVKKYFNKTTQTIKTSYESGFEYPTMEHGASNTEEKNYGIYILRCQNNTAINNNTCYDDDTSHEIIMNAINYQIFFIDQYIDVENFHNPFQYFFHKIYNILTPISFTLNYLNFHTSQLKTQIGIVFDEIKEERSYVYETNEKQVTTRDDTNNNIYGGWYFCFQNMNDIYVRKYQKLQDICGSIGGMIKLILVLAQFLNYYFHQKTLYKDLEKDINTKIKKLGKNIESSSVLRYLYTQNKQPDTLKEINYNNSLSNNNLKVFNKNINLNSDNVTERPNNKPKNSLNQLNSKKSIDCKLNNYVSNENKISPLTDLLFNPNNPIYPLRRGSTSKKFSNSNFFAYIFCPFDLKSNKHIKLLFEYRRNILSEEGIFSFYYVLNSLQKIFTKKGLNLINENNI